MAWETITESTIKGSAGLTGPELTAARTAALPSGVSDTLADVIERVVNEVRGYVGRRNTLADGDTIPAECLTAALSRIVFELCLRIPRSIVLTDERKEANRNAIAFLKDVARGDVVIVPPETAAAAQPGGNATEVVNSRDRIATREKLAGL